MINVSGSSTAVELKPSFAEAADELRRLNYKGRFGLCDLDENRKVAREFSVYGSTIIKLFKDGLLVSDYYGALTAGKFKLFMIHYEKYDRLIERTLY